MTDPVFEISTAVEIATLEALRRRGRRDEEGVVLWRGTYDPPVISGVIVPQQETGWGRFVVPLSERQRLSRALSGSGEIIVAQVHSHPAAAFHSDIDDEEAIPRRVGSLSLVVPDFGERESLLDGAALYCLQRDGSWTPEPLERLQPATPPRRGAIRWLIDTLKSVGR